jgi:mannose-6-phosphate isomerase-like protein (cupin superfamily)
MKMERSMTRRYLAAAAAGLGLASGVALSSSAQAHQPTATPASAACAQASPFTLSTDHLDGYRVFTGPDGTSQVAPLRIDARTVPLFKTGQKLGILDLPRAPNRNVQIVVGPPNLELPMHAAPYKEMFVILSGSVTLLTKNFKADLAAGSVLLFEDVTAHDGHGGRTGPCVYISVSIAP